MAATARYQRSDPEHHHHQSVDDATGSVEPFTDDVPERAIGAVAERRGVQLDGRDVVLRGTRR
jgi:Fe2+ or Zn2+ uptake regulation protein